MREWLFEYLVCPECRTPLTLEEYIREEDVILEGILSCPGCWEWYPIVCGVPRLVQFNLRRPTTEAFLERWRERIPGNGIMTAREGREGKPDPNEYSDLKLKTMENFGFEWREYARYGWSDARAGLNEEEGVFLHKSLLQKEELSQKLVLDGGCGNGRYSYWGARYGARVVAVDISDAVDAAFTNTRQFNNIGVVQADLFKLPFRNGIFDAIFSIGVLMHTGDAREAFFSLVRYLAPGGSITVHVYGKGNWVYEVVDAALRCRTTKMTILELKKFALRIERLGRLLDRIGVRPLVSAFVRLDRDVHSIFDWYAAPVATHHSYAEVKQWFREQDLQIVRTNEHFASQARWKRVVMTLVGYPWPVTVRGRLSHAKSHFETMKRAEVAAIGSPIAGG